MLKAFIGLIVAGILIAGGYYAYSSGGGIGSHDTGPTAAAPTTPTVTIRPIEHASAIIDWNGAALYTDPTGEASKYAAQSRPEIIFITDIHRDHFSTSTLAAIAGSAMIVVPQAVKDLLPEDISSNVVVMKNGEMKELAGYLVTAIPMYNYPEATSSPHTKGRGNGYLIEKDKFRVYVAGDTGPIPEMRSLRNIEIALIPMNLPYTMSVQEAASAVVAFKPKHVYPYHYRGQEGLSDVNEFKRLVNEGDAGIDVQLLDWYPNDDGSDPEAPGGSVR